MKRILFFVKVARARLANENHLENAENYLFKLYYVVVVVEVYYTKRVGIYIYGK